MFKQLLRTIPNLSGNVKLACEVSDYVKFSDDEYIGSCRNAHLFPLASTAYEKKHNVSLLTGNWEYDIVKFYKNYSDIFYTDLYNNHNNTVCYINNITKYRQIEDRNTDFEFGCRRISYQKSGQIFSFYAPIYCDNLNDLPDYFMIVINFNVPGKCHMTKKYIIPINDVIPVTANYLTAYLKRYFKQVTEDVIYMKPTEKYSLYYGIDVKYGGFNKYKDNISSKLFNTQYTINDFDRCISEGFKRNNMIMQQILPLAFYFNPNDILTETELEKYQNAELKITGCYYKNDEELPFYNFDDNYTTLYDRPKKFNKETGEFKEYTTGNNLLTMSGGLHEGKLNLYKYENKLNKEYVRWKLKYTSDENPYIINNNIVFSKNQGSNYYYKTYPQRVQTTELLCNIDNNEINVLLPIGSNIEKYYEEYRYIVDTFESINNDYINDWFDVIDDKTLNYIIRNANWQDVNKDGKILYKGLLYNFNSLYLSYDIKPIDKFAVLFYLDTDNLITNNNRNNLVLTQSSLTYNTEHGNINSGLSVIDGEKYNMNNALYSVTGTYLNYIYDDNDYFIENSYGTGKFVDINDLGADYYVLNGYKEIQGTPVVTESIKNGYELLPIHYIQNINIDIIKQEDLYYSEYNNPNNIQKLTVNVYNEIKDKQDAQKDKYLFFKKRIFESRTLKKSNNNQINGTYYIYNPKYAVNDSVTVNDVFTYVGQYNKFYGNNIPSTVDYKGDNDILYLDPYNIKENIENYYILEGTFYINNILKSKNSYAIELKDFHNDSVFMMFINDTEYNDFAESFDIESTYVKRPEYNNNKFLLKKYIRRIYNIYKETIDVKNNKALIKVNEHTYTITGNNSITVDYHVIKKSELLGNRNAELIDNVWLNTSSITGNLYVSNINTDEFTFTLTQFGNNGSNSEVNIQFKLNSLLEFYQYGLKLGCVSIINDKYFINHTGVGTCYSRTSKLYKHPQNIITKISNIQFLTKNVSVIDKTTSIYKNIELEIVNFNTIDETNNFVIHNNFVDNNIDNKTGQERGVQLLEMKIFIDDTVSAYGKLMNLDHLYIFKTYMLGSNVEDIDVLSNCYIKSTYIVNGILKHKFVPISQMNANITLDKIHYYADYLFTFDGLDSKKYELYVKKNYIRISEEIYNSILCLNSDNYNDLYIYRLEQPTDTLSSINITVGNSSIQYEEDTDKNFILYPVFNNVFVQNQIDTVIYQAYLMRYLSEVIYNTDDNILIYYRYMKPDKVLLYDVSEHFTPDTYSFIYDTEKIEINTSYYLDENLEEDTDEEILSISYYASNIKTYDDYGDFEIKHIDITDNKDLPYDKTNLNLFTDIEGTTYGFYLTEIKMSNISDLFKLVIDNGYKLNYFTKINGISITDKKKLSELFKLLVPAMNYNILSQLNKMKTLVMPYKTVSDLRLMVINSKKISNKSSNSTNAINNNTIDNSNESLVNIVLSDDEKPKEYILYRYFDAISPIFVKGPNIKTEYARKNTYMKVLNTDTTIYNYNANIYKYEGLGIYDNISEDKKMYIQPEYKYFNDNRFINLVKEFEISVSNNLTYNKLLENQKDDIVKKYFAEYINKGQKVKFNNDEILFLFNRYDIKYLSKSVKVQQKEKIYDLTYKFILK